jgi:putative nucleotidyltransferase with HDIG domain
MGFSFFNNSPAAKSRNRSRLNAKASLQKQLLLRLALAAVVIAAVLAVAVFFNERSKVGHIVSSRANQIAARFNDQIIELLDTPGLSDRKALQQELNILFIAGNLNQFFGHLVCVSIYDSVDRKLAAAADDSFVHITAVQKDLEKFHLARTHNGKTWFDIKRIDGEMYVHVAMPLTNSRREVVAHAEGMVAVNPDTVDEIESRIVKTVVEVILIVFVVTAFLYPVILSLIGKLSRLADSLLDSNLETLRVLGSAVAKRDSETDIHNYRVTIYAVRLAEAVGLDRQSIRSLIKGAFLHDVGKIGISDQILMKPNRLSDEEFEVMKGHVKHGVDIVERSDWLKDATQVVGSHHEQYAGDGYPVGIGGTNIPITARIFAIADVFDALTSKRPYKDPIDFDSAIDTLKKKRGGHLDPMLVDAFVLIARPLFDDLINSTDDLPRRKLEEILQRYFSDGFETIGS